MTDIVERLRVDGASKIEWEAADEIERLRAAPLPDAVVAALEEARGFCIETPCLGAAHVIELIDAALGEAKDE